MAGESGYDERQDLAAWKRYKTGARSDYDSIRRDHRGYPLFVRGTNSSKDWDHFRDAATDDGKETMSDEDGTRQQVDDIFSATRGSGEIHSEGSTSKSPTPASSLPQDPERGKLVASFYSKLPRDAVVAGQESRIMLGFAEEPQLQPRKVRSVIKSGSDWFIRKASAQLLEMEAAKSKTAREAIPLQSEGSCSVCLATLPTPLSTSQWDAHRSSIAHQLVADGPVEAGSLGAAKATARRKSEIFDGKGGRILLKPSNLGYTALERMGWRKGMGLGREEWEYGEKLKQKIRGKRLRETHDVIVISDSDEEEEDDLHFEIGSEEWLSRIHEEQARLAASRPAALDIKEEDDTPIREAEEGAMRSRPLLEPIAVHLRPDRRGIGKALPATARIIDGKKQGRKETEGEAAQPQKRLTKSQKRQLERLKQEEWKQLRSSLN